MVFPVAKIGAAGAPDVKGVIGPVERVGQRLNEREIG